MPRSDHAPSIKDDERYEALRRGGYGKEKAARIANAGDAASRKGGRAEPYEEWTREELYRRAKELEVEGRSSMTKRELIGALRSR